MELGSIHLTTSLEEVLKKSICIVSLKTALFQIAATSVKGQCGKAYSSGNVNIASLTCAH